MSDVDTAHEALMQFLYRAPIGLLQTTLDGTVEMINPMSACLLLPLAREGSLDNLFGALEGVAPQLRDLVMAFAEPAGVVCDALRIHLPTGKPGDPPATVLSISLVKLDEARLMGMVSDVTQEVQREQFELSRGLDHAARTDRLTQMPNRAVVRDRIQQALDQAPGHGGLFAVLLLNCDRFNEINDRLGRVVGDELLGLVADRLRSALRQRTQAGRTTGSGETAARTGGDEFAVFLDRLRSPPDDVAAIAQRLLDSLGRPYMIGAHELHCTVSVGVVLQAEAAGDADVVLQEANIAMMEAKRAGGNCFVVFERAMQERAARLGGLVADLRRAISERELFVMYQPVVDLQGESAGGGCAGVEALVRWRHPTRGVVPPLEFITAAEECGLIGAIGEFVLETACREFVAWCREIGARAPRRLAVNVSRAQLTRAAFVDVVREVIRSTGIAPAQLQLEVTESLAAQDSTVQERLRELKALGLTLALDDFGTGFSSLASLHTLPVDTVKIDRSFVIQSDTSRHHHVLIKATVLVATSLDMGTVAEGIETEAQAAVARELGCDKGQGYFFSKPLLPEDLVRWLTREPAPSAANVQRASRSAATL